MDKTSVVGIYFGVVIAAIGTAVFGETTPLSAGVWIGVMVYPPLYWAVGLIDKD